MRTLDGALMHVTVETPRVLLPPAEVGHHNPQLFARRERFLPSRAARAQALQCDERPASVGARLTSWSAAEPGRWKSTGGPCRRGEASRQRRQLSVEQRNSMARTSGTPARRGADGDLGSSTANCLPPAAGGAGREAHGTPCDDHVAVAAAFSSCVSQVAVRGDPVRLTKKRRGSWRENSETF